MTSRAAVLSVVLAVLLLGPTACAADDGRPAGGGASTGASGDEGPVPADVVAALEALPTVADVVPTPPEDHVALPGGPTDRVGSWAVLDSRFPCDQPGIECGAVVEVWGSAESAERRSEEMTGLTAGMLPRDAEQHVLRGSVLLRLDGRLTRKQVAAYAAALEAA